MLCFKDCTDNLTGSGMLFQTLGGAIDNDRLSIMHLMWGVFKTCWYLGRRTWTMKRDEVTYRDQPKRVLPVRFRVEIKPAPKMEFHFQPKTETKTSWRFRSKTKLTFHINVSQGSLAMHSRDGGIFYYCFSTNYC